MFRAPARLASPAARSAVSRSSPLLSLRLSRGYATPPPSGQPAPDPTEKKSGGANMGLITAAVAVAAGGYYYYSTRPQDTQRLKDHAKKDELELKTAAQDKVSDARARAQEVSSDATARYGAAKSTSENSVANARHAAERKYSDIKNEVERKYDETQSAAESSLSAAKDKLGRVKDRVYDDTKYVANATAEKGEAVKRGWFSWLGWGKSKARESKEQSAQKVAETAGDVKKASEKHA